MVGNIIFKQFYGPVALLISRDERISLITSLSAGERKKEFGFSFKVISVIFMQIFYFSPGLLVDSTKVIVENICSPFQIIINFILKRK